MSSGRDLSSFSEGLRDWLSPKTETVTWYVAGEEQSNEVNAETDAGEAASLVVADLLVLHLKWLRSQMKDPSKS